MDDVKSQSQPTNSTMSLEKRFCSGDDIAFDEVVAEYGPTIQQLIYRLLGWSSDVDDIVQDVFVAALTNRRKFKAASTLKTWLFTITMNQCRKRYRRSILWQRFQNRHVEQKERYDNAPENNSLQQEKINKTHRAIQRLPGKYRDVIVLKYLEELSTGEILEIMKIQENTFYTRLNRAKQMIQRELQDYMNDG